MGRKTILTQKEIEAFIKNPPIGFISVGAGLILPCIFLGEIVPYNMKIALIAIGILSVFVGIVWCVFQLFFEESINGNLLNFSTSTCPGVTTSHVNFQSKKHKYMIENSPKLKALINLNEQYSFKRYVSKQSHNYRCKNKREFDRMSTKDYFYNCVLTHYQDYLKIIESIKYNKNEYDSYSSKVRSLASDIGDPLCDSLKISYNKFKKREEKLFQKIIYRLPLIYIDILCEITYTSPKGRNYYRNSDTFYFNDLEETLRKIKNQKTKQETIEYKVKHERSKMSPSLRYDILKRDGFKCQICGASANNGATLHVDHILPVSKGGKTEWTNLRTLCDRCNLGKSDKIEIQAPKKSSYTTATEYEDLEIGDVICGAKKIQK